MAALASLPPGVKALVLVLFLTICAALTYVLIADERSAPPRVSERASDPGGPPAAREPGENRAGLRGARSDGPRTPPDTGAKRRAEPRPSKTAKAPAQVNVTGASPIPAPALPDDPLARSLLGKVQDESGVPIAGAVVMLDPSWRWVRAQKDRANLALTTMTGADGSFVLGPLPFDSTRRFRPSAAYRLKIRAPGYYPEAEWFHPGEEREVLLQVPGSLGGRVAFKGRERAPCAGAKITFTGPEGRRSTAYRVECDVDGRFFHKELRPGSYTLTIVPRNRPPVAPTTVVIRAREHTDVRFEVEKGVTVHGRVTARSTGQPLAGVTVFTAQGYENRLVTGADGRFLLQGLPRKATVKFFKTGYLPADVSIEAKEGEEAKVADAALLRPATVQGKVVGPDGAPVVGARVAINEIDDRRLRTRAEGEFTIPGVWPAENLRVRAWKRGFEGAKSLPFSAGDGQVVTNILVRLGAGAAQASPGAPTRITPREWLLRGRRLGHGVAKGTVLGPEGKPVAGAKVEMLRTYPSVRFRLGPYDRFYHGQVFLTTRTDALGNYRFERLPVGLFLVGVSAQDFLQQEGETFELLESSLPHDEIIRLSRGFWVEAEFQDQVGRPLGRRRLVLTREYQRFGKRIRVRTDAEGKARIGPVGVRRYRILVWGGNVRYHPKEVSFRKGEVALITLERTTLALKGGEIKGTVFRGDTGAPAPEFWIALVSPAGKVEQRFADSQGRFTWSRLEDGAYQVGAWTDDGWVTRKFAEATVKSDVPTPPLMIMVHEGGRVSGAVLDPSGSPLGGARVSVHSGDPGARLVATAKTDSDGKFTIAGLVPGKYVAVAAHDHWVEGTTPFTVEVGKAPTIRIRTLDEGATASVTVVDAHGRPVHGAELTILRSNGRIFVPTAAQIERRFQQLKRVRPTLEWGPFYVSFFYSDRDGRLLHPFIPPGRYRFRADKGSLVSSPVEARMVDRRRTSVRLVLKSRAPVRPAGK
jgi:protocatechuate 3,4-dioxygenase beta subunit